MEAVFLKLLNMSIAAGWLVLAVAALRVLLKNAPKSIRCFLWALVAVRLVFPFSIESAFSLIPSAETVPQDIMYEAEPSIHTGVSAVNSIVNPVLEEQFSPSPEPGYRANPMQTITYIASIVWIVGMAVMAGYAVFSYVRIRRKVSICSKSGDNLYRCDYIDTPFILGIIKPKIYIPSALDSETAAYVAAHEKAHLKRHDHWWKPLGFVLLSVYWFNPLIWLAYVLLCRDIEFACDEKVIRELGESEKKAYSNALLFCSVEHKQIAACPLAFGEAGVKERIQAVLHYKKPAFRIMVAAVIACVILAVCFLTNPQDSAASGEQPGIVQGTYISSECLYITPASSSITGNDSGKIYQITEDSFIIADKSSGDIQSIRPVNMEWQDIPYTDEEWEELYVSGTFGKLDTLRNKGKDLRYMYLSEQYELLWVEGDIWLVELKGGSAQIAKYIWSIYLLVPDENAELEMETIESANRILETEEPVQFLEYSNAGVRFQYPSDWVIRENSGEDGAIISLADPQNNNMEIFTLQQGEAWRVNLEYTMEEHQKILEENYENAEIMEFSSGLLDECDMTKLVFSYIVDDKAYRMTKYLTISGLVSFEFSYTYPAEKEAEYAEEMEAVIASVDFLNSDKEDAEQNASTEYIGEALSNVVIADTSVDFGKYTDYSIKLVMTEGRYYTDEETVPGGGIYAENYDGNYVIQVIDNREQIVDELSLNQANPDWGHYAYAPAATINFPGEFELCISDYNKDELPDFTIGTYGSSSMNIFELYTIDENGKIKRLAGDIPSHSKNFSVYFSKTDGGFYTRIWNNVIGMEEIDYYQWNQQEEKYYRIEDAEVYEESLLPKTFPMEFYFTSGAGAWSTDLILKEDGTFEGIYHDSDMGSQTVYICEFSGKFTNIERIDEYTYSAYLEEMTMKDEIGREWMEDNLRYIASEPYGMETGKEFLLYRPEKPVAGLQEEFLSWWPDWNYMQGDETLTILSGYGLYNVEGEYGFFTY